MSENLEKNAEVLKSGTWAEATGGPEPPGSEKFDVNDLEIKDGFMDDITFESEFSPVPLKINHETNSPIPANQVDTPSAQPVDFEHDAESPPVQNEDAPVPLKPENSTIGIPSSLINAAETLKRTGEFDDIATAREAPRAATLDTNRGQIKIPCGDYSAVIIAASEKRYKKSGRHFIEYELCFFEPQYIGYTFKKTTALYLPDGKATYENEIHICNLPEPTSGINKDYLKGFMDVGVEISITQGVAGHANIRFLRKTRMKTKDITTLILEKYKVPPKTRRFITEIRFDVLPKAEQEYGAVLILASYGASFREITLFFRFNKAAAVYRDMEYGREEYLKILYDRACGESAAHIWSEDNDIYFSEKNLGLQDFINVIVKERVRIKKKANWDLAGEGAVSWFIFHGALFFIDKNTDELCMMYQGKLYPVNTDKKNRAFLALFKRESGQSLSVGPGPLLFDAFINTAYERAGERTIHPWFYYDRKNNVLYIHLHDEKNQILRIAADGITLIPNGANDYNILLEASPDVKPITYLQNVSIRQGMAVAERVLLSNLACAPVNRLPYLNWNICAFLKDMASTAPHIRNIGAKASAKTSAAIMMSTLIFGDHMQMLSTVSALYADMGRNPVIYPDNRESNNTTKEELDAYLFAATGGTNKKRRLGSSNTNVTSSMKCYVNSTGIEPIGAGRSEFSSRTISIPFDPGAFSTVDTFSQVDATLAVQKHRNIILSAYFKKIQIVLGLAASGAKLQVMRLLQTSFPDHANKRMFDALALMYLMSIADDSTPRDEIHKQLETLTPEFQAFMAGQKELEERDRVEANPIAEGLLRLFYEYNLALEADKLDDSHKKENAFISKYQISFSAPDTIHEAKAKQLHAALLKTSPSYSYPNANVLARRIENDLNTLGQGGFTLEIHIGAARYHYYTISISPEMLAECPKLVGAGKNPSGKKGKNKAGSDHKK